MMYAKTAQTPVLLAQLQDRRQDAGSIARNQQLLELGAVRPSYGHKLTFQRFEILSGYTCSTAYTCSEAARHQKARSSRSLSW